PQQVLGLTVLAAVPSATISASVATAALALAGVDVSSWHFSRMCWGADVVGILLIAPLLLVPEGDWAVPRVGRLLRLAECAFVLVMMMTLVAFAFGKRTPPDDMIWRMPYLYTVPFLLWSGVRFGQRAGAFAALLLSLLIAWYTTRGCGPIAWLTSTNADRVLMLHVCLSTVVFTVLLISSAVAAIKDTQTRLLESEEAYRSLAGAEPGPASSNASSRPAPRARWPWMSSRP
ncbi:MASE1 domain-containing protein, partial [Singulisphaera rosea]